MKKLILILAAIAIAIPAMAQAKADPNIVVILRGAGVLVETPADVFALGVAFTCFETALFDAHTDKVIGTGTDCLDVEDAADAGISINRVTIFNFPGAPGCQRFDDCRTHFWGQFSGLDTRCGRR